MWNEWEGVRVEAWRVEGVGCGGWRVEGVGCGGCIGLKGLRDEEIKE